MEKYKKEVSANNKIITDLSEEVSNWKRRYEHLENSSDESTKALTQEIRLYEKRFSEQQNAESDAIRTITKFIDEGHIPEEVKAYNALDLHSLISIVLVSHQNVSESLGACAMSLAHLKERLACEEVSKRQNEKLVEYLRQELSQAATDPNFYDGLKLSDFEFPDSPHLSKELTEKLQGGFIDNTVPKKPSVRTGPASLTPTIVNIPALEADSFNEQSRSSKDQKQHLGARKNVNMSDESVLERNFTGGQAYLSAQGNQQLLPAQAGMSPETTNDDTASFSVSEDLHPNVREIIGKSLSKTKVSRMVREGFTCDTK